MFPESFKRWTQRKTSTEIITGFRCEHGEHSILVAHCTEPKNPTHECRTSNPKVNIKSEDSSITTRKILDINARGEVVDVMLTGPRFYCSGCKTNFPSTVACVDADIPPKARFSNSWAQEMVRQIAISDETIESIAARSRLTKRPLKELLDRRIETFNAAHIEYQPCEELFILPLYLSSEGRFVVGGQIKQRYVLYDILPFDTAAVTRTLRCLPASPKSAFVGLYADIISICKDVFPNMIIYPLADRAIRYIERLQSGADPILKCDLAILRQLLESGHCSMLRLEQWYVNLKITEQSICYKLFHEVLMSCGETIANLCVNVEQIEHFRVYLNAVRRLSRCYEAAKVRFLVLSCQKAIYDTPSGDSLISFVQSRYRDVFTSALITDSQAELPTWPHFAVWLNLLASMRPEDIASPYSYSESESGSNSGSAACTTDTSADLSAIQSENIEFDVDFKADKTDSVEFTTNKADSASAVIDGFMDAYFAQVEAEYHESLRNRCNPVFEALLELRLAHIAGCGVSVEMVHSYTNAVETFMHTAMSAARDLQDFLAIANRAIESDTVCDDLVAGWVYYYAHNDLLDKMPDKVNTLYTTDDLEEIAADPEFSFPKLRITHGR